MITVRFSHVLVAVVTAVILWAGPALVQLSAGDLTDPKKTLISMGIGLSNAIGVGLVHGAIPDGFTLSLQRPTDPPPAPPPATTDPMIGGGQ